MREIEFRGKTEDGEWVYGFFLKSKAGCFIAICENGDGWDLELVIFETVCEYTGLKDVYENDYCEMYYNGKKEFSGLVKHKVCGFWLTNVLVYNGNKSFATNDLDLDSFDEAECEIKVIGNIYENKDLRGS